MPLVSKRANLLEQAIAGLACTDREACDLAVTAARIPVLISDACAPRDEFVRALGDRLRAEALTLPLHEARPGSPTRVAGRGATSPRRPRVLVIGGRLPRALLGATASLLVLGAILGGASRSALPGSLLYPMRQMLDSAAVRLAGSDLNHGVTLLSQGREHIGDARALVERDVEQTDPASVNQALLNAYDAVRTGQRALLGDFDRTGNTAALEALQDFTVRTVPQLNALRPLVPPASVPGVDALLALLQETRTAVASTIAVCGQPCASLATTSLPVRTAPGVLPLTIPAPAITRPVGPGVGITASAPPVYPRVTGGAVLPPVTLGSSPAGRTPVVVPPPRPPLTPPTALTATPTGLPGLPGLP